MDFDQINKEHALVLEYVERFGPLPDFRLMAPDDLLTAMDRIKDALDRGRALTAEEWGVSEDIPDDATI